MPQGSYYERFVCSDSSSSESFIRLIGVYRERSEHGIPRIVLTKPTSRATVWEAGRPLRERYVYKLYKVACALSVAKDEQAGHLIKR